MCGRINVIDAPLSRQVSQLLGIDFRVETNRDLRPTQALETLVESGAGLAQQRATWGIQPPWAHRLLINAKAETVADKSTFKQAFAEHRCLVPCSGWYEWREEGGPRKRKYLFEHTDGEPLYMAALWYPGAGEGEPPRAVTLTTAANARCAPYHPRMPLLILPESVPHWLGATVEALSPLLVPTDAAMIRVLPAP